MFKKKQNSNFKFTDHFVLYNNNCIVRQFCVVQLLNAGFRLPGDESYHRFSENIDFPKQSKKPDTISTQNCTEKIRKLFFDVITFDITVIKLNYI